MPEKQVIIRPGMDESMDARYLPEGTPRLLQNVRVRQGAKFEKRPGQTSLGTSGLGEGESYGCFMGEANGVAVVGISEATNEHSQLVYTHNGLSGANRRWSYLGRVSHCVPLRRFGLAGREVTSTAIYHSPSMVAVNGLLYAAFSDEEGVETITYILELTPEGAVLRSESLTGTDKCPRLIYINSTLLLVTNAAGTIKVRELALSNFQLGAATSLATAAASSSTLVDAAPFEGGTSGLICYATTATNLRISAIDSAGSVLNSGNVTTTSAPTCYTVAGYSQASGAVVVAYADGLAAQLTAYDQGFTNGTEITIHTLSSPESWLNQFVLCRTDTDSWALLMGGSRGITVGSLPELATPFTYWAQISTATAASVAIASGPTRSWHIAPSSKAWRVGEDDNCNVYAWCSNGHGSWNGSNYERHLLINFDGGTPQFAGVSYEHQATVAEVYVGSIADIGDGRFAAALNWADPGKFTGIDCVVMSAATASESVAAAHRFTEQSGGSLFISGGCLYDIADAPLGTGYHAAENGFVHPPIMDVGLATGGNLRAGTEVSYVACYRRIDGRGRVQRSASSEPVQITPTGTYTKVNTYVSSLGVSNRWALPGETVVSEVYRSDNGGPYYYVGATDSAVPTGLAASLTDTSSLDDIIDDDGALDVDAAQPEPPSGARLMRTWGQRCATVGWRENEVQLSKFFRSDTSWEFAAEPNFRIQVAEPVTALGWMDGAGVIFTARKIYICSGDGPDDRGAGEFDRARELPATVGADSPHVVESQQGLMFKGGGTIWLLPRGFGAPQPVGDAIQRTLEAYPYLRSAVRCANDDYDLTHFLLAASDLPGARTLFVVWNNTLGAWSRDQLACDLGAAGSLSGVLHVLLATWTALSQAPARKLADHVADLDNSASNAWIESRVGFGDLRPWGPLGWGRLDRIMIHGEVHGSADLNLVTVIDGVTGMNARGATFTAAKHMTGLGQFYAEHQLKHPPGGAFRFDIYDSTPTLMTSGLAWHGVAFTASEPDGLRRVSDSERF
jgi:hypothetical protein